ncbi:MAG: glycosyltransferase family 2 protein [Coriobacteriia bacterium]|nr:glycosyltransferase family 2 protein [Coriobacteriia bacterium]
MIPAHDERSHISSVVDGLPEWVDDVVVVDDASSDETAECARGCIRNPVVIVHEVNAGVGGAVVDGYLKALELGADVIARLDGDGQMNPAELSMLVEPVASGRVGFAKGNRFKLGRIPTNMPSLRTWGNLILTFLTKLASGYWHLFDPQNGYSAISADAIEALDLDYLRRGGYFFENALLIELNSAEVPALDVPISTHYGTEVSGLRISKVLVTFPARLTSGLFRRMFRRYVIRDFSPVAVFLMSGSVLFFGGTALAVFEWVSTLATGRATPLGSIMLAALPMFIGFELLLQGLVLDINGSPR